MWCGVTLLLCYKGRHMSWDEDFIVLLFGRDDLRVPTAPPFFAHGWVLCAADGNEARIASDANIAANAFADIFVAAFFDFVWQKWICDAGACRADQVHDSALDG